MIDKLIRLDHIRILSPDNELKLHFVQCRDFGRSGSRTCDRWAEARAEICTGVWYHSTLKQQPRTSSLRLHTAPPHRLTKQLSFSGCYCRLCAGADMPSYS